MKKDLPMSLPLLGYLFYAATLALALFFWRERLDFDTSWYLTQLVDRQEFVFEHRRPISFVSQWLPLLLVWAGAPLSWVLKSYSFCDWLYYFGLFNFALWGLKDRRAALALCLLSAAGVAQNYYNPVSELILAGSLLVVIWAAVRRSPRPAWAYGLALLGLWLVVRSHALFYLTIPILLLWTYAEKERWFQPRWLVVIAICFLFIVDARSRLDAYELNQIEDPAGLGAKFQSFFQSDVWRQTRANYWAIFGLVGFTVWRLAREGRAVLGGVYGASVLGCFLFVAYKSHTYISYYHFERYLYPFVLLAVTGFAFYGAGLKGVWPQAAMAGVFLLFLSGRVATLRQHGQTLQLANQKIDGLLELTKTLPEQKFLIRHENYAAPNDFVDIKWSIINQTLLATACQNPDSVKQIVGDVHVDTAKVKNMEPETFFYTAWWPKRGAEFNDRYFRFRPSPLRFLNTDGRLKDYPPAFFENFEIETHAPSPCKTGKKQTIFFTLHNRNAQPLWSGSRLDSVCVVAYLRPLKGATKTAQPVAQTPVLADVNARLKQSIEITAPQVAGKYELLIDLQYNNQNRPIRQKRWTTLEVRP